MNMQNDDTSSGFLNGAQLRLIAIVFLGLASGGLALWLFKGESVYLNMLFTGLMNCF